MALAAKKNQLTNHIAAKSHDIIVRACKIQNEGGVVTTTDMSHSLKHALSMMSFHMSLRFLESHLLLFALNGENG